jgi:hypothetical protein
VEVPYCDGVEFDGSRVGRPCYETKQDREKVDDTSDVALKTVPAPEYGKGAYWIPSPGGGPWSLRVPVPTVCGTTVPKAGKQSL